MSFNRYIYRDKHLTDAEARTVRAQELRSMRSEIFWRKHKLRVAEKELRDLQDEPLRTSIRTQITVQPGEPGYDELPPTFDPINYQGDFMCVNMQAPEQTQPTTP